MTAGGEQSGREATMETVSAVARAACAAIPAIEALWREKLEGYFDGELRQYQNYPRYMGQDNEYYPIPELRDAPYVSCGGMHIMEPEYGFVENSFVVSAKVGRDWRAGAYCDSDHTLQESDPVLFSFDPENPQR